MTKLSLALLVACSLHAMSPLQLSEKKIKTNDETYRQFEVDLHAASRFPPELSKLVLSYVGREFLRIKKFELPVAQAAALAVSPNGKFVAAVRDKRCTLFSTTNNDVHSSKDVKFYPNKLVFSPRSNYLALAGENWLQIFEIEKNDIKDLSVGFARVGDICFSPDEKYLAAITWGDINKPAVATGGEEARIVLYNPAQNKVLFKIQPISEKSIANRYADLLRACFSGDGRNIYIFDTSTVLSRYDVVTNAVQETQVNFYVGSIHQLPNSSEIICVMRDGRGRGGLARIDAEKGVTGENYYRHDLYLHTAAVLKNDNILISRFHGELASYPHFVCIDMTTLIAKATITPKFAIYFNTQPAQSFAHLSLFTCDDSIVLCNNNSIEFWRMGLAIEVTAPDKVPEQKQVCQEIVTRPESRRTSNRSCTVYSIAALLASCAAYVAYAALNAQK